MSVHLLAPEFLLLLLLVPAAWLLPRRATDAGHAALRSVVLALAALGLARPVVVQDEARPRYAIVVDRSPSVEPAAVAEADLLARSMAAALGRDGRAALIEVGPPPAASPARTRPTRTRGRHALAEDGASSPLAAALAEAARTLPDGSPGAIALFSDGLATEGGGADRAAVTQDLTARGVPVHTFELPAVPDVHPVAITALGTLRVGHTARLVVEIVGAASVFDVVLSGPAGELGRLERAACAGRAAFAFELEPEKAGFVTLAVELEVGEGVNPIVTNDRLERTFAVQDPLRVLYLGRRAAGGAGRLGELLGPGFDLDEGAPTDAGTSLSSTYDLVVLDDQRAEAAPEAFQRELARAVIEDGLGVFMSGGSGSFGPGGWHETPLADVLPVEFQQKEEKRDPSTTLVVIIDTSGSMGGNRVQLAKEVSRLAIRRLLPHDKVGIVEFYGAKHWAAPIQPASNSIELERALNRLDAGGGTVILPAIAEAFYALQNVQTRYKHVMVLTDGGVETGAFEPLLRRMAEKGINVSTVLIGPEAHSEFLVTLANWGKGRFYNVPNRFNLPEILLKQPTSAKLPAYRPGSHPVQGHGGAGWWGSVDPRAVPAIAGYVETRARPGAEVLLETREGTHPVLATWQPGLGRVSVLTTEPTGPGTEPWREWDGYAPWLARVLARTAADTREPYAFSVRRDGTRVVLRAERRKAGAGPPRARVLDVDEDLSGGEGDGVPGGVPGGVPLAFRERADGLFETRLFADPEREVRFVCGAEGANALVRLVLDGPGATRETQVDPAERLDLARLARATGGTHFTRLPDVAPTLALGGATAPVGLVEWRPWLLFLALCAYLFELLFRRRGAR